MNTFGPCPRRRVPEAAHHQLLNARRDISLATASRGDHASSRTPPAAADRQSTPSSCASKTAWAHGLAASVWDEVGVGWVRGRQAQGGEARFCMGVGSVSVRNVNAEQERRRRRIQIFWAVRKTGEAVHHIGARRGLVTVQVQAPKVRRVPPLSRRYRRKRVVERAGPAGISNAVVQASDRG